MAAPSEPSAAALLVRLRGIGRARLPPPPEAAAGEALVPFLSAVLREAAPFIDSAAPKSEQPQPGKDESPWKRKGTKTHADSAAPVEVSERWVETPEADGGGAVMREMWCCRRSVHEDAARAGTATWAEFDRAFRTHHAESEKAFTPNVRVAREAVVWDCAGARVALPSSYSSPSASKEGDTAASAGTTWYGDFRLVLMEMRHRVGPGLQDRTFPVLQVSCRADGAGEGGGEGSVEDEFFVVSIPVPDFGDDPRSTLAAEPGALVAAYVSVERIRRLPGDGKKGDHIEWLMATSSDAGGVLPAWIQNIAMPAVIWKDVPLFLSWAAKERGEKGEGAA